MFNTTIDTRSHHRFRMASLVGGLVATLLVALSVLPSPSGAVPERAATPRPTVILVHGAWADNSSWKPVVRRLQHEGLQVRAFATPLRSLSGDSAHLEEYLATIAGPIVLVGHSYGAAVITNAATGNPQVTGLVYVNGSVPDVNETVASLAGPDSALSVADPTTIFDFAPATLPPTATTDVYLKTSTFVRSFATGLRPSAARALAATQRPITFGALNEPSGEPAWRTIPSWYLIGGQDLVIPRTAQRAMARRAGAHVSTYRAGHLGLITKPRAVTRVILKAVTASR